MAGNSSNGSTRRRRRRTLMAWGSAAALMVLPIIALRAGEGRPWAPGDVTFLAILLAVLAAVLGVSARIANRRAYAAACALALVTGLFQAWINLAVGIIGSEDNPANWMYGGVILVAIIGAILARFRPAGMARAMIAAAAAQASTFIAAIVLGFGFTGPITVFLVTLWLVAASLFRQAARARTSTSAGADR